MNWRRRVLNWLDSILVDCRFAVRQLRSAPGFTIIAILTIALGIGANTAVFGLVDSVFLQRMPFHEPKRLVNVWTIEEDGDVHTPVPAQYQAIREQSRSFDEIAAGGWGDYFYSEAGASPRNLPGFLITANWLPTLGVQPLLGRNFRDEEQIDGRDAVALLSYDCWKKRFGSDTRIVGRQIELNRRLVTIIGVLPQALGPYYRELEIFAPLVLDSYAAHSPLRAGRIRVEILARLKSEVTLAEARTEMDVLGGRLQNPGVPENRANQLIVQSVAEQFENPGPTEQNGRRGLGTTAIAAGIVLLVACVNVAALVLVRAVRRRREMAVRVALGCSRGRLIRQTLIESTLLFLCGGALALLTTSWCAAAITNVASGLVSGAYLEINAHVFVGALVIALTSAVIFGLIPALASTRVDLNESLKDSTAKATAGTSARNFRRALVASQLALGMILLVGFGLLWRSLLNVESSPMGYDPQNVLTVTAHVPAASYTTAAERSRLMREAADRVRAMPGVVSVGVAGSLPMLGAESTNMSVEMAGREASHVQDEIYYVAVSPDYFSTLKVAMLAGRAFGENDDERGGHVAIVNETFAKKYFPEANPIGSHISFADSPLDSREIVGVVSDFRQRNPEEDLRPLAYFPILQTVPTNWSMAIRVRTASELAVISSEIPDWLRTVDSRLYWETGSLEQLIFDSESLTMRRPIIVLVASFGTLTLLLVLVGVFGLMSYSVAERTHEMGIRIALGSSLRGIAKLVLSDCLHVSLAGLAAGAFLGFAVAHFLPNKDIGWSGSGIFLYHVSRADGLTYFLAAIVLTGVALAAAWMPVRRAMRVDPIVALRHE
jgi:putative ABC transport system permease protein